MLCWPTFLRWEPATRCTITLLTCHSTPGAHPKTLKPVSTIVWNSVFPHAARSWNCLTWVLQNSLGNMLCSSVDVVPNEECKDRELIASLNSFNCHWLADSGEACFAPNQHNEQDTTCCSADEISWDWFPLLSLAQGLISRIILYHFAGDRFFGVASILLGKTIFFRWKFAVSPWQNKMHRIGWRAMLRLNPQKSTVGRCLPPSKPKKKNSQHH